MAKDKQESLSKEANPGFDGETFTDEWHNAPNCTNITVNKNPFPVYNLIIVFVPNHLKFKGNNSLSSQYQCFYYEILTPGKIITDFVNDHTLGNGHLIPELYFTDTQNNQWRRSKNGELKKDCLFEEGSQVRNYSKAFVKQPKKVNMQTSDNELEINKINVFPIAVSSLPQSKEILIMKKSIKIIDT
ncbi:hypothetical protein [Secundilactobacillus collinoides]|uniref:hypothetical protein n=1 Tax=Secundilactobacillus collinoides TaxID=33960 RepID=UPI0006D05E83|nr:hypothetical protein [Secundilactobacillus collinoides]